ncbi:NUDIX hydrolase [Bailinhaonella thermotolerans]|uniref:CoA pyrophosphatase n=1 Tax=Bailinhaonella thermotolerans TaxID=1070861 RepID=A0A3A4A3N5_9ACTN|nr:CoA pyrophosphatase [Bailinhaonella thermotolerans]RJL23065.1 CoA pyrophosphatase [Bailinhaonella thermotolerans]
MDAGLAELRERIAANLTAFPRRAVRHEPAGGAGVGGGLRRAAVVVLVFADTGVPCVLLLRRGPGGRNAGQWALPGGRLEPGEDEVTAALRELREETGAVLAPADVAGLLDDYVTDSGFVITPVVAVRPGPIELRPDPVEVASLHPVPLDRLLAPGVPRWHDAGDGRPLLQMPLGPGILVHAPTGALLYQFREAALLGRPTRVHDTAQPDWTRD